MFKLDKIILKTHLGPCCPHPPFSPPSYAMHLLVRRSFGPAYAMHPLVVPHPASTQLRPSVAALAQQGRVVCGGEAGWGRVRWGGVESG
jgi:hypothetical protein